MIDVQFRKGTRLIDITATSRSAALARDLANGYANEYLRLAMEQNTEATRSAAQFLIEETQRLTEKLRLSEEAMQSFRERERTPSFDAMLAEADNAVKNLAGRISEDQQTLQQLRRDVDASAAAEGDEAMLLKLPSIRANSQINAVTQDIEKQDAELEILALRYRADHPLHTTAKQRIQSLKKARSELLPSIVSGLTTSAEFLETQIQRLELEKATAEKRLLEVTAKSLEYNSLSRDLEADRALYGAVIERLKEIDVTKGMTDGSVRIHDTALGASPTQIPVTKILLTGLLAGVAAGLAIALLLNAVDTTIQTVDQAERWTGLHVITAVPEIKAKDPGLITMQDRHGIAAEAFRTLRTSIALLGKRETRKVFLFTSALPSEGKTFSSSNFAVTLAQQGFRTLYVDADLRKPAVSKIIFGEERSPGLTDVLLGEVALEEAVLAGCLENLTVLTAGKTADNPSELLSGPHLQRFFEKIRSEYDRIVLDSAPLIPVSDTLLLLGQTDVNCLIVRAQSTPKKSVLHAIRLLQEVDSPPAGIVINRLRARRSSAYYAYAYSGRLYGGYGSKGVYGQKA
jgi:capsular exopolysaccharide synthesis family protein